MSAAAVQPIQKLPKVLIVDDHHLLLEALTFMMTPKYEISSISSLSQLDFQMAFFKPRLVVIDISMPDGDGVSIGQQLTRRYPGTKLVFLSMHTDAPQIRRVRESGAQGFVSKKGSADDLLQAIDTVLSGGQYYAVSLADDGSGASPDPNLTERQKQVLRLVARGYSAKEIATDLSISVRTAEFHRGAIMQRLKMHSTALLTRYAVENGLV